MCKDLAGIVVEVPNFKVKVNEAETVKQLCT